MRYSIETSAGELDVYYDLDISLNYQISDILDLNSRSTSWSKTIKVPGTDKNNLFFKNIYDVNVDAEYGFNARQYIPAKIRVAGDVVFDGFMQLLNIQETNKDIEYEVSFVGLIGTLFGNLGDYTFGNLDLSEYDHQRTRQNVMASWEGSIWKNGTLKVGEPGEGYVYPHIYYGGHKWKMNELFLEDMYPAFYVKTIWDKVLESAGFTYTSKFLNSETFTNLIIPFNGDKLQMDGTSCTGSGGYTVEDFDTTVGSGDGAVAPISSTNLYTPLLVDPTDNKAYWTYHNWGWNYNSGVAKYHSALNIQQGTIGGVTLKDTIPQLSDYDLGDFNGFLIAEDGSYDIDIDLTLCPLISNDKMIAGDINTLEWKEGSCQYRYQLIAIKPDGTSQVLDSSNNHGGQGTWGVIDFNLGTGNRTANWNWVGGNMGQGVVYEDITLPVTLESTNVFLPKGTKVVIRIGQNMPKSVKFKGTIASGTEDKTFALSMLIKGRNITNTTLNSVAKIKKSDNSVNVTACVSANQVMNQNVKLKDYLLDIIKMFNLVISDNPNKENDLIIEPYDDWFETKPKVIDWSPELDEDATVKLIPMSELDFNRYRYSYTPDDDFLNSEYTTESNELIYGEYSNQVPNSYQDAINEITVKYAPTPVGEAEDGSGTLGWVIPIFATYEDDEYVPYKAKTRILFWNGKTPIGKNIRFNNSVDDKIANSTDYDLIDEVPVASMWNNVLSPTETLEWGRSFKHYFDTNLFPNGTLFELYHKNTLNNIIDPNSMIMECDILLTPKDMAEFDFRSLIYARGCYWRVNEIKNYNPINSDKTTRVVLYKVIDVNIIDKLQIEIPTTNKGCKKAITVKKGNLWWYQNEDGSAVNEDCCLTLGGQYGSKGCLATPIWSPPLGPILNPAPFPGPFPGNTPPYTPTGSIFPEIKPGTKKPIGGPFTFPITEKAGPFVKSKDRTKNNGIYVKNGGYGNVYQEGSSNSLVLGNYNTLENTAKNNIVLGNGIIANEEGSIYLQNAKIDKEGQIRRTGVTIIDGGEDTIFPFNKTNPTEIIDGTIDAVRNIGASSWSRPIIDGNPYTDFVQE